MIKDNIYLTILDLAQRTGIRDYFNFYKQTLTWSRKQIENYQGKKLRELVLYAQKHVPHYREAFQKAGISADQITGIKELEKLPILTREHLRDNFEKLSSDQKDSLKFTKSSSSGTTGTPIHYLHDREGNSSGKAAGFFFNHLSGWRFGKPSIHIWGNPVSVKHWQRPMSRAKRFFLRQENLAAYSLQSTENFQDAVNLINTHKPFSLDGHTSSIYNLANYIKERGLGIHRPQMIFTTAENLQEKERLLIEEVLGPISDIYGCSEINGVAVRPIHDDRYYILEPHVILETIPILGSKYRELLITNLDNRIMPFIRYKVGDLIDDIYEGKEDHKYRYSYFKKLHGRSVDIIDLGNGKKISSISLFGGTLFREIGGIIKHKVVLALFHVHPGGEVRGRDFCAIHSGQDHLRSF